MTKWNKELKWFSVLAFSGAGVIAAVSAWTILGIASISENPHPQLFLIQLSILISGPVVGGIIGLAFCLVAAPFCKLLACIVREAFQTQKRFEPSWFERKSDAFRPVSTKTTQYV
jgi:hypothetical protein